MEPWAVSGWGQVMFPDDPQDYRFNAGDNGMGVSYSKGFIRNFIVIGCTTYKFIDDSGPHKNS